MNIQELTAALEYAKGQLFQAELRFDQATEKDPIDAAIFEQKAWENMCKYYRLKLKEAVKSGQAIQNNGYLQFGGRL